jgi:hypothetical protein
MFQRETPQKYWNIFAFELKKLLHNYDMDLGHLDDRVGIHRETVRRLKQSLGTPSSLPVLSREDTQMVIDTLQLSQEDILRLRAAVLATSIQRMLCDRIEPEAARLAAEQLLPIIYKALIENANKRGLGNVRTGDIDPLEDSDIDQAFESILGAIDCGIQELHLSYNVPSHRERVRRAYQAKASFDEAYTELDNESRHIKQLPQWKIWVSEVEKGKKSALERLDELGE